MVVLAGAGMGEDGLISLKAYKLLSKADVVVYDRLIDMRTLLYARPDALFVRAGKGPQDGGLQQEGINQCLIGLGAKYPLVVRLHGGDPFVFGRGGEEAEALRRAGISVEIVPGVSSIYAAAAYAGVPVTHREYNSSLHVYTAHKKEDKAELNFKEIATLEGTVVFLMGSKSAASIAENLMKEGKPPQTPLCFVQNAASPKQRAVFCTLAEAPAVAAEKKFHSPLVIVIGGAVSPEGQWFQPKKNLLFIGEEQSVLRAEALASNLACRFIPLPVLKIKTLPLNIEPVSLKKYSTAVFTSPNAVRSTALSLPFHLWDKKIKIGAIGESTRKALKNLGAEADFTSSLGSEELLRMAAEHSKEGGNILVCTALKSGAKLHEASAQYKRNFQALSCYESLALPWAKEPIRDVSQICSAFAFTSALGVEAFFKMLDGESIAGKVFALGPSAQEALEARGFEPILPIRPDYEAFISCIEENML